MIYLLIILNITSLGYLLLRSVKDFGKVNYFLIFSIFNFLYTSAIPIEIVLFRKAFFVEGYVFSMRQIELIIFLSTISNIAFYIGLYFSFSKMKISYAPNKNSFPSSILLLNCAALLMILIFFRTNFLASIQSYQGNFTTTYNNSIYAYSKDIIFFTLSVLSIILIQKKKSYYFIISATLSLLLGIIGFLSSDKNPILLAAIPWIWLLLEKIHLVTKKKKWRIIAIFIIGILIIPTFNSLFGIYRANWDKHAVKYYSTSGFESFESRSMLLSFFEVSTLQNREYGKTYFNGFVNWIPKGIWKDRPENLAESYAKYKIPDWEPGKGIGFSFLAESYLNFGIYGTFIQYLFLGILLGIFKIITHTFFSKDYIFSELAFFIWIFNDLVLMHRGPFNMPSSYIRFFLPLLVAYFFYNRFKISLRLIKWTKN